MGKRRILTADFIGNDGTDEGDDELEITDSDDSDSDSVSLSSSTSESDAEDAEEEEAENVAEVKAEGDGEEEEEDDLVKSIRKELENKREIPRDIVCDEHVVQLSFHPKADLIAVATIMGDVLLYKYCDDVDAELRNRIEVHTRACRDIDFNEDGTRLFSVSKDKSMMVTDVDSGALVQAYEDAHADPLYCMRVINENQVATGDDSGTVKLWDLRSQKEIFSLKEVNDFVSCMVTTDAQRHLACTTGEGAITVFSMRQRKLHSQSELYEVDLNCLAVCRSNSKLVCGTSDGKLLVFNWMEFGCHADEFPGPKFGINRIVAATENIVITACDDGNIRATHLFPNRHLGVMGQHAMSAEALDISGDGRLIASCSHDQAVKFWNIKYLEDVQVDGRAKADKKQRAHNLPSSKVKNANDFFDGLGEPGPTAE